jgi:hypothetical protein
MTLEEFILESKRDVDRFREMWADSAKADPVAFPDDMNPGDWFDQFMMFISGGGDE